MQVKTIFSTLLIISSSLTLAQSRKPNSLIEDFKKLSGSYKLEKGNPVHCPDGEVTTTDDKFLLGADLRIEGINKNKIIEKSGSKSACSAESQASFNGKQLKYITREKCNQGSAATMTYIFDFYQTNTTEYISLKYSKTSELPNSHNSSFSFQCLYSRDLKN